ncbi:MAG: hypothetical protein ACYTGO_12090 [Planctomycetota bacterium]|jgi:hypothetical protein
MTNLPYVRLALCAGILATGVIAQIPKFQMFPAGTDKEWGGGANTIPFWTMSATYQQVLDRVEMAKLGGGSAMVLNGLFFRAPRTNTIKARSLNAQIKLNHTTVTAATATTTFSTNLESGATTVLPFTKMSFSQFTGTGDPSKIGGMVFNFNQVFIWNPALNKNLVFEIRYKDGSPAAQTGSLDAIDANSHTGTVRPAEGKGCLASDRKTPTATAISRINFAKGSSSFPAWNYNLSLLNGRASSKALWLAGIKRKQFVLPGACSSLEVDPLLYTYGTTTAATGGSKPNPGGRWDIRVPTTSALQGVPRFEVLSQFAWDDPGLPLGVGVSNMTVAEMPLPGAIHVSRIYSKVDTSAAGNTNGFELATTAQGVTKGFGLVTGLVLK